MKMIFRIKHTKQNLFEGNFLKILTIFFIVLIIVLTFIFFGSVRSLVLDIFSPFLKTGDFFYKNINWIPKTFSDKNKLIRENENLLSEIENYRLNLIDYESLKYENKKLRDTLKIKPIGDTVSASVIAKSPQVPLDSLLLNQGVADGLNNEDLVLVSEKILIGRIVEISKNKSTVALNSFAGRVSYGFIARTDEPLEIKGIGGGSLEVKVPIDFDIVVGDKIMFTGPPIYLMAVVGMIEEDRSSGFKNVLMSLPVNVSKINTVFIGPYFND